MDAVDVAAWLGSIAALVALTIVYRRRLRRTVTKRLVYAA